MTWLVAICIALSTIASLILVPIIRQMAIALGMIDRPDQDRKLQTTAVALGGGVAVFASLVVAFVSTIWIDRAYFQGLLGTVTPSWYVLFGSATAILAVGVLDDLIGLRGRQKLLLQCLIVACLVGSGTIINQLSIFGNSVQLGVLAFPVTVLWLIVAINALNLIDGADGMATTVGTFICIGLGALSLFVGSPLGAVVGFSLAGAQLGFLRHNFPPATIYLGDAGSMMIGLFVGVLAIWGNVKESAVLASAPIAVLALPLFDSTAAVLRRWLTGRSLYVTDRAHLHHLLQKRYGKIGMLFVVASLSAVTTALSIISVMFDLPWLSLVGVSLALAVLVSTRSFGNAEAKLVVGKVSSFAKSFTIHPAMCEKQKVNQKVAMQGDGPWETVWEPLVGFADRHGLAHVKIDLNLSWLEEGFHASWRSVRLPEKASRIKLVLPLFHHRGEDASAFQIGTLEVVSVAESETDYQQIADLTEHLIDLGPTISGVVDKLEAGRGTSARSEHHLGNPVQEADRVTKDSRTPEPSKVSEPREAIDLAKASVLNIDS